MIRKLPTAEYRRYSRTKVEPQTVMPRLGVADARDIAAYLYRAPSP